MIVPQRRTPLQRVYLRILAALPACLWVAVALPTFSGSDAASPTPAPALILDRHALAGAKQRTQSGDPSLMAALDKLRREADRALSQAVGSVTEKKTLPPSGDRHDYMSTAPYWWPNPNTADGLPYLRRDGNVNPERDLVSDRNRLAQMIQGVKTTALGYYFLQRDAYADHAAKLMRAWFLDHRTRMSPHLRYAQAIPGRNHGRAAGIIETHDFPDLLDAAGLLAGAKAWQHSDQKGLRDWFSHYLNWLVDSAEGRAEAKAQNNHGSWYDVQVACFARFVGQDQLANKVLAEFARHRVARQIEPDGRQPYELGRTQAWNYSIFNLAAFFSAAGLGDKLGIDLWSYETPDKRSLRRALDWLTPFATGEQNWSHQQITKVQREKLAPLLRRAALSYREPAYENAIAKLVNINGDERWQLLYPRMLERQ